MPLPPPDVWLTVRTNDRAMGALASVDRHHNSVLGDTVRLAKQRALKVGRRWRALARVGAVVRTFAARANPGAPARLPLQQVNAIAQGNGHEFVCNVALSLAVSNVIDLETNRGARAGQLSSAWRRWCGVTRAQAPPPLPTSLSAGFATPFDSAGFIGFELFHEEDAWEDYVLSWDDPMVLSAPQLTLLWDVMNLQVPERYLPVFASILMHSP